MPSPIATSAPFLNLEAVTLKLASEAGEVNILRGIDLAVTSGETVAIIGPSGSGKSTLMMIAAGLERPSSGRVSVAGVDFATLDEDGRARFRRDHVGIVFQSFHLVATMSALENVAIPLEFAGRPDAFDRARELLGRVGLAERVLHYPGQLSGGEQQRVALARAFAASPRLVLADEPTGNLDQATGHKVIDLMFELQAQSGATLVLITHDPAMAEQCSRIVTLEDGLVAGDRRARG